MKEAASATGATEKLQPYLSPLAVWALSVGSWDQSQEKTLGDDCHLVDVVALTRLAKNRLMQAGSHLVV